MKKLGLIGGTGPESTIIYYHSIVNKYSEKSKTHNFPNITIESLSVFDVLKFCNEEKYQGLTEYLLKGINSLKNAGADFAALTGITPHIVFDDLKEKSPIKLISMVDTSCKYAINKGYKKLGLLGTLPTMNKDFFKTPFLKNNIEIVTPTKKQKEYVANKISTELEFGKIIKETRENIKNIVNEMVTEEKIDAVILGCTELPLIFKDMDIPIDKMDVMEIHINTLTNLLLSE